MPEDPDISKRRIEQQQLRKQLHEVFGPFEQFCEYVAGATNAGSSGIMRHGVVQIPTTSAVLSMRSALPASASSITPTTQQSTQQLLQSMQNLVTSPIQPIQGISFSFNRDYIDHAPSSSTHSAPETSNCSNKKVKRHRMQDSDTELERDKRKRRNDELSGMPGTSRSNAHSSSNSDYGRTMLRENVERKDPPDKGISPDSGVHSTENDPGDENDIHSAQTIINLITKLSPPLSPIKQRPFEKKAERERKELEMRERERKERYESQMREEEERERLEKEQAERDEKLKSERLEYERKERDREEKQRKDKERDEKERRKKEEREEKDREEKERKEKEREWRNRREREVEDKFKEQKEHEDHLRRDAVREMKKQKGVDYASVGKRSKDSCRKDGQERVEKVRTGNANRTKQKESDENLSERISRLDGEITLKGLDRLKLNQLIEIGRRMGRMKEERVEDRKERNEELNEKRKEKKERERCPSNKQGGEELDSLRKDKEMITKNSPCMPRASSSQSHDGADQAQPSRSSSTLNNHSSRFGFECAALECAPAKSARPVKPKEDSTEMLYDFYQSVAKSQKRKGDAETDKVNKVLFYLDTAVYFILSARHVSSDSPENRGNRQYSIIRDTNDLLKRVTHAFSPPSEGCSPWHLHMLSRVRNLSSRCQSTLLFHLYNLRSQNAIKSYSMLAHMDAQIQEEQQQQNGSTINSSSPGSSVHSNSNQSTTFVSMPSKVYDLQRQQLKTLHHLMWSHRVWQDAAKRADVSNTDMAFISGLEKVCGQLFLDAPLEKMCAYMLTGIGWLRAEYEKEKARPPPPIVKRAAAI